MEQSRTWACAGMGRLFHGCAATGEVYTLAAVACSELPGLVLQGPAHLSPHTCLNVRTGHITNTKQGDFCCLDVI